MPNAPRISQIQIPRCMYLNMKLRVLAKDTAILRNHRPHTLHIFIVKHAPARSTPVIACLMLKQDM